MLAKLSGFFGEKPNKNPQRKIRKSSQVTEQKPQKVENPLKAAKELFWGKYPHYPEMSSSYRGLFQKLKMDNSKTIKFHETLCGTDLCTIASGIGPHVDYCCLDQEVQLIAQNIKKFDLANKTERAVENEAASEPKMYFAHLMSFYPQQGTKRDIDWHNLADHTLPGGYVIDPQMIAAGEGSKKSSQKIADNIEFYYYTTVDHTAHWISVLNERFTALKNIDPESWTTTDKTVIKHYGDEATKWAMDLKGLKSGEFKMISMIYKRDE